MNRSVRVPIRIRPSSISERSAPAERLEVAEAAPPVVERGVMARTEPVPTPTASSRAASAGRRGSGADRTQPEPAVRGRLDQEQGPTSSANEDEESVEIWRDRALRLQAEIDNFRKRQRRLAEERVVADRERLLRSFLRVGDDLERALAQQTAAQRTANAGGTDVESLRQGVDLTYRSLMHMLDQEGAEPIEAAGQPFDPAWHEAVGTVPSPNVGVEPDTVVEVVQTGYRLGDRLLRPARVIAAT